MVLIGSYRITSSNSTKTLRLDITTSSRIWHCLNESILQTNAKKYNFEKEDVIFAIVEDKKSGKISIFGDDREANIFMDIMMRGANSSNSKLAESKTYDDGSFEKKAQDGSLKAHYTFNQKGQFTKIEIEDSMQYSIYLTEVSAKPRIGEKYWKFSKTEMHDALDLAQNIRDVTTNIAFPTQEEAIRRFGLEYCFDSAGNLIADFECITSSERLKQLFIFENVTAHDYLSFDIESTGLNFYDMLPENPLNDSMVGICLAWRPNQGIYIPFEHTQVPNLDLKETMDFLQPIILKMNCVGANIMFDARVLYKYGYTINFTEDILLLWYNIDPARAKYIPDLKGILENVLHIKQPHLKEIATGAEKAVKYFPWYLIIAYCCGDACHTLALLEPLRAMLKFPEKQLGGYYQDIKVANALFVEEYHGVLIDTQMLDDALLYAEADMKKIQDIMFSYMGQYLMHSNLVTDLKSQGLSQSEIDDEVARMRASPEFKSAKFEFNPGNDNEMRQIFYQMLGVQATVFTKKNQPSVGKEAQRNILRIEKTVSDSDKLWLKEDVFSSISIAHNEYTDDSVLISKKEFNSRKHPLMYLYCKWKLAYGELTKFFMPLKALTEGRDGHVYLPFRIKNTETYRITHRLQTLKGVLAKMIVSPKGWYGMSFDAAAIEVRNVCGQANETIMIERLNHPETDSHIEIASIAYQVPPHLVTKDMRKNVKAVVFGSIYGISEYGLCVNSLQLEPTDENLQRCRELMITIMNILPRVFAYGDACAAHAYEKEFIMNPDGRCRFFNKEKQSRGSIQRQGKNTPIQSHSAGIFRLIFLKFIESLKRHNIYDTVRTYLLVHDELKTNVHGSNHPYLMCSIVYNDCILKYKNHPTYYLGVGFGNNAYECKDDKSELPILFLKQKSEEWEAGLWKDHVLPAEEYPKFVADELQEWMMNRYVTELQSNGFDPENVDIAKVIELCHNYYIGRRLGHFVNLKIKTVYDEVKKKKKPANRWGADFDSISLVYIMFHRLGLERIKLTDGTIFTYEEFLAEFIASHKVVPNSLIEEKVSKQKSNILQFSRSFTNEPVQEGFLDFDESEDIQMVESLFGTLEDSLDYVQEIEVTESDNFYDAESALIDADVSIFDDDDISSNGSENDNEEVYRDAFSVMSHNGDAKRTLVDPTSTDPRTRYSYEGIDTLGDFSFSRKYTLLGTLILIDINGQNYKAVIEYLKKSRTVNASNSYKVTLKFADGRILDLKGYYKPVLEDLNEVI